MSEVAKSLTQMFQFCHEEWAKIPVFIVCSLYKDTQKIS